MSFSAVCLRAGVICALFSTSIFAQAKFDRVWVLSGGGFRPAAFIAMLDVAAKRGVLPEVVINSCGVGLSLFLYKLIPDEQQRTAYLRSPEFHAFLRELISANKNFGGTEVVKATGPKLGAWLLFGGRNRKLPRVMPDLFSNFILTLTQEAIDWRQHIPENIEWNDQVDAIPNSEGIRIVSVTSRLLYAPEEANRVRVAGRKLFREVLFTDKDTAKRGELDRWKNPTAAQYPESVIETDTETITELPFWAGIRASFNNPYLFAPMVLEEQSYINGSTDMYPIQLGRQLLNEGGELVVGFNPPQVQEDRFFLWETLAMDMNDWHRITNTEAEADRWIDFSDLDEGKFKDTHLNPKLNAMDLISGKPIVSGVPEDYKQFVAHIDLQYEWGKRAMEMALNRTKKNDKSHIHYLKKAN